MRYPANRPEALAKKRMLFDGLSNRKIFIWTDDGVKEVADRQK